ncbi:MAG TPA: hypothetical protein VL171_08535 [Verrucomicrobiae bacterium]|nr:hypothetical protein [Verrucomicrobiae bacterium]
MADLLEGIIDLLTVAIGVVFIVALLIEGSSGDADVRNAARRWVRVTCIMMVAGYASIPLVHAKEDPRQFVSLLETLVLVFVLLLILCYKRIRQTLRLDRWPMICLLSSLLLLPATCAFLFANHSNLSPMERSVPLVCGVIVGLMVTVSIVKSLGTRQQCVKRSVWILPMLGSIGFILAYDGSSYLAVLVFIWADASMSFVAGVALERLMGKPIYWRDLT